MSKAVVKPAAKKPAAKKPVAKKKPATKKKPAAKKVARKVGFKPFPIATALLAVLRKSGKLRLVRTTSRASKFTEIELLSTGVTVREGAVGAAGRIAKKLTVRTAAAEAWALRQAKSLLAKDYAVENVAIDPTVMATWLAEVKRLGKARGWEIESEKVFTR